VRPSGRAEVTRLPEGGAAARHRHRQHAAEATAEADGVLPHAQKRSVSYFSVALSLSHPAGMFTHLFIIKDLAAYQRTSYFVKKKKGCVFRKQTGLI